MWLIRNLQIRKDIQEVVDLYRRCFAEPPWFEVFDPAELETDLRGDLVRYNAVSVVVEKDEKIVGVGMGFGVRCKDDVKVLLPQEYQDSFYVSELFVDPDYRRQGICQQLVYELFEGACWRGWAFGGGKPLACVRTSINQPAIINLFASRGFKVTARQDVESVKMIDGNEVVVPDTRVILIGRMPVGDPHRFR